MPTKEQERSGFALRKITDVYGQINENRSNFANFVVGAPTMILQNGLGQTMAFLLSKAKGKNNATDKHRFVFNCIRDWCISENAPDESVFKTISDLQPAQYIAKQQESLAMLQWLKRYARAFENN